MEKLLYLFPIILLISCQQSVNKTVVKKTEIVKNAVKEPSQISFKAIPFKKVTNQGILIGNDLKLLDEHLNEIKDISSFQGQIIQVIGLSNSSYKANPKDEYCQEFRYVKVRINELEGFVDGRKVYGLTKGEQNKTFNIEGDEISFTTTNYYGIGVADSNGLTGCETKTPVVFSDKNAKYKSLLKIVKNKYVYDDYPYFELKADDGSYDEIISVNKENGKYILEVKRDFQEGIGTILIAIYRNSNGVYVAEIIDYNARKINSRNR